MSIKIGCIADTHVPTRASKLPERIFEIFNEEKVKFIFFAGDLVTLQAMTDLESNVDVEETIVVSGNMDKYEVKKQFPKLIEREVLGHVIMMAHKLNHVPLKEKQVHLAIFGHTHRDKIGEKDKTILLNPGSGTGSGMFTNRSVGIIEITKEKILPSIKKF